MAERIDEIRDVMSGILHVPVGDIGPETSQADLETWDSVEHLNLMLAIEERFGISLEVEDLTRMTSVPAIMEVLGEKCPSS